MTTLGPVTLGMSFILGNMSGGTPRVLGTMFKTLPIGGVDKTILIYNLSPLLAQFLLPIPTFILEAVPNKGNTWYLKDTTNNGYLGYNPEGVAVLALMTFVATDDTKGKRAQLTFSQKTYAPWSPPAVLLAGVEYAPLSINGPTATSVTINNQTGDISFPISQELSNVIFIPTYLYVDCTGPRNIVIDTPRNVLVNWICEFAGGKSVNPIACSAIETASPTWTTLNLCNNGVTFNYCAADSNCGTANCNGPCTNAGSTCDYISSGSSDGTFICSVAPVPPEAPGPPWWTSTGFIVGMVALGIVIVILIIVAIVIVNKVRKPPTQDTEEQEFYNAIYS